MPHSQKDTRSGVGGPLAAGAATLLVVACCALGPALIAGGVLGVAGGVLRSPALLALAALVLIGAVWIAMRHRTRGRRPRAGDPTPMQQDTPARQLAEAVDAEDCCSPPPPAHRESQRAHDQTSQYQEP